jgi:hypothetical protein
MADRDAASGDKLRRPKKIQGRWGNSRKVRLSKRSP